MSYSIKFYIEKRRDKKTGKIRVKNVPILFSLTFDRQRIKSTTGLRTDIKLWDEKKQRFKRSATNAAEKNKILDDLAGRLEKIYLTAPVKNISAQYVRNQLEGKNETSRLPFFDAFDRFVQEKKFANSWSERTVKGFTSLKNHLLNVNKRLDFSLIDEHFYNDFLKYMIDRKYKNSNIKKQLKLLTWFFNWCESQGVKFIYDFHKFNFKGNVPKPGTNIRPLTMEELGHMYEMPIHNIRLDQVRDCFCFSCFTGLRYSDLKNLKKADIAPDGAHLSLTMQKTATVVSVPLIANAQAILNKYKNTYSKYALPVLSQQKYNDYLKELGQLAELNDEVVLVNYSGNERIEKRFKKWEKLTSHTGRQTFVSNAIRLGISPEVVRGLVGQSSDAMLRHYFKVMDTQKDEEMQKFENYGNTV